MTTSEPGESKAAGEGEGTTTPSEPPPAAPPPSGPSGPSGRGSRRRPWLIAGAAVLGVLLLFAAFGAGRATGRWHDGGPGWHGGRGDHWGAGRMHDGPGGGPWMMGERGEFGDGPGWGRHERGGPGGPGGHGGPGGQGLAGTVASVNGPSLVVNTDGGGPVTVTTSDRTRVAGEQRHSVADLKPGDRVLVRVRDANTAVGVFVPPARAFGTVTALEGDRATVTRPDGLTQAVDVSGVTNKPKAGDRVDVRGVIADNGATLKASSLRTLPK
ncbi:DUF5666 domain-containing protein [Pseudonocardia acaciae]|uniref:DUF5666 domain-containing protein n=1 Tax=Pseudonocardia acaciae TaxID=551276 RepID=UPI00068555EE|nr:DUF5666 domain-containing protein [Pseudonocardia acaciae]